ncbi:MAG: hypothetical protein P8I93_04115 [Crocinitomicaceae bacterium]|nr:hypothetical protein [Crocinitomicaceae bacterium]
MFYDQIQLFCSEITSSYSYIPSSRLVLLDGIVLEINKLRDNKKDLNFLFVCTHNSRRSQFANVWAEIAAAFYNLNSIKSYSCGTERSIVSENTIQAFEDLGLQIKDHPNINNAFLAFYGKELCIDVFSKKYSDASISKENTIAMMTCSDADKNCPIIPYAKNKVSLNFKDPKRFDNTSSFKTEYQKTAKEIAREIFYIFSKLKS